jgi:hypothetical protein
MRNHKLTGIYENISKKRWEFWTVSNNGIKVLVSWLSWGVSIDDYKKWENNCFLNKVG